MKKKILAGIMAVFIMAIPAFAMITEKLIDNFEKNSSLKNPEWWKFDNITASVEKNPKTRRGDKIAKSCGRMSLHFKGSAKNWYCGGIGTYLGVDATGYTGVEMTIYGKGGDNGGKIKIELYDDDKKSFATQYDKAWVPIKDDMWAYEQSIDWKGWETVYIPFASFKIQNPRRGDGKMNFDQLNGSGGLLQLQMILIGGTPDGEVNVNIDNIKLITAKAEVEDE